MKYIKKYNESNSDLFKDELEYFCKEYLVYLVDEGFSIYITNWGSNSKIYIDTNKEFNWLDIKDDFIQFYEMLKEKYIVFSYYAGEECYVELLIEKNTKTYRENRSRCNFDFYDKLIYKDDFDVEKIKTIEIIVQDKK